MLQLESVRKVYRKKQDEVVALDTANLEIPRGDYVAIIGPSGSGKTTLLSILGAMSAPSEGRILLDGESVYDLPINARAELRQNKIGFVFQTFNLIPYLTAMENVQIPMLLANKHQGQSRSKTFRFLCRQNKGIDSVKWPVLSFHRGSRITLRPLKRPELSCLHKINLCFDWFRTCFITRIRSPQRDPFFKVGNDFTGQFAFGRHLVCVFAITHRFQQQTFCWFPWNQSRPRVASF